MPKNLKEKKVEKSLEGKSSGKKKVAKTKLSDSTKSNAGTEEIKNLVIEDENWQCSVVLLVPENHKLNDFLLQMLANLPENFTVLTKDAITNNKDKKSRKGSKTRSSIRSTSKSSKRSSKSKATKSKNKLKKEVDKTELLVSSSNDDINRVKECLALKKHIINLRNNDIANTKTILTDGKTNIGLPESKFRNNDMRTRGSGDGVENKTSVIEENVMTNASPLHRFVLLLGFYDPLLPEVLNEQNVSMKAVINVRNPIDDNTDTYSNERLSTVTAKSKRKPSKKSKKGSIGAKVSNEYSKFVEKIVEFSSNTEFLEKCKDVIFLNYTLKSLSVTTKEMESKYKADVLEILYKIQKAWNKYKHYTATVHVQNIPTVEEILKLEDAKIYSTMISMVPLECTSTAVILHCIVEQVAWWNDDKQFREESDNHLLNDSSVQSNSPSVSTLSCKNKTPILIHHRDEVKYNTFHLDLPEFDFERISTNVCMKSPVFKLWERYPAHTKPVRKWFEFQLQKLQNLSDNSVLKLDSFFPIYLHFFLMDVLIFKTNLLTKSKDDTIVLEPEIKNVDTIFLSGKEPEVRDSNSDLFVKEIIHNMLCKIPDFSLCQNYAEVFEIDPYYSMDTTRCSLKLPVYTNRLENKTLKELPRETLLQKREFCKQEKLSKLVSFLNCSEFVNLYEDFSNLNFCETKRLAKFKFIEILNSQTLCQCLQLASQAFSNINYDYFPVTDSILLWFNNNSDQVLSSETSKVVMETPLGFRDFYCHKLSESTDFGGKSEDKEEVTSGKSIENSGNSFVVEHKADLKSCSDHNSDIEDKETHFRVEAIKPIIVYNFGSLWMESTESFNNFSSLDSSSVSVKKVTCFNKKSRTIVNVKKNNTSVKYELDLESSNHFLQLFIEVQEILNLNCVLNWNVVSEKSFILRNNTDFPDTFTTAKDNELKLNCSLSITLPSGLFIEVVPTNSIFGPFYIRQRYLGKGPNCSSIWEESYRCYFNNGMVLIFRADGSVDIIYNNGTVVKCHSIELIKSKDLSDDKGEEIEKEQDGIHETKESPSSRQKKKGKVKADSKKPKSDDVDGREVRKQSKKKKDKSTKGSKNTTENREEKPSLVKETENNVPVYKIVQHSVLSWDGEYSQFDSEDCKGVKKLLSLRTAFDIINHELYWQRSDGTSCLQAPDNQTVQFPDGNRITSFTIENKELWVENDYAIIYRTSGDLVKIEPFKVLHNTNNIGVELNKGNGDSNRNTHLLATNISSFDSFGTEYLEDNSFVYVENSFLMEHTNYATVEFSNEDCEIKLILPGNCWIIVDESGRFSFKGDKNDRINLFDDNLVFEANVLSSSNLSKSSTTFRFENVATTPIIFSQTEDSFGHVFSVDERGNTTYLPSESCENLHQSHLSQHSARFPQNTERLFVFNRDLTGYEMIHEVEQANTVSNRDVQTVNTPVIKGDGELYSLYVQSPIYKSKCEEYTMHGYQKVSPNLIKRKDLLKAHKTPETIWFYPEISSVKKLTVKNETKTAQLEKTVKAMMIVQRLKVKKRGSDVISLFSQLLTKYMEINEQIYQKYSYYHPKETLKEDDLIESEANKMNFLGSKSYYLTDNLPVAITREMANKNEPNNDIFSIFSPSVSKVSF